MITLLVIGFGLMVLALRLRLVRRTIHRGQGPTEDTLSQIFKEGRILFIGGLALLALTLIWDFGLRAQFAGYSVLLGTGSSLVYMSLPSLLQWIVGKRRGTEQQIHLWENILIYSGIFLIAAYAIYLIVVALK